MLPRRIAVRVCCCLAWAALAAVAPGQSNIVISQVYGGGGNAGATFRNDFVELFNRGTVAVNIGGWTVQYAPGSGSSWDRVVLTATMQPGQQYLVQLAEGSGGSTALPAPDATGGLNLSATAGKLAWRVVRRCFQAHHLQALTLSTLLGRGAGPFFLAGLEISQPTQPWIAGRE